MAHLFFFASDPGTVPRDGLRGRAVRLALPCLRPARPSNSVLPARVRRRRRQRLAGLLDARLAARSPNGAVHLSWIIARGHRLTWGPRRVTMIVGIVAFALILWDRSPGGRGRHRRHRPRDCYVLRPHILVRLSSPAIGQPLRRRRSPPGVIYPARSWPGKKSPQGGVSGAIAVARPHSANEPRSPGWSVVSACSIRLQRRRRQQAEHGENTRTASLSTAGTPTTLAAPCAHTEHAVRLTAVLHAGTRGLPGCPGRPGDIGTGV